MSNEQLKPIFGPSWRKRLEMQRKFTHNQDVLYQTGGQLYPLTDGDYCWDSYKSLWFENDRLDEIHSLITSQIRLLADNPAIQRPVIYLDLGGGFGVSSIQIAIALQDLIRTGRVVCLVSNMEFLPSPSDVEKVLSGSKPTEQVNDFLRRNMHLIHYIKTDAAHLPSLSVNLGGNSLRLAGNLDFVHECNVLIHSKTPDIDFWAMGRTLSSYGTLMLDSDQAYNQSEIPNQLKEDMALSFQAGMQNLRRMGLNERRFGFYHVFQKG